MLHHYAAHLARSGRLHARTVLLTTLLIYAAFGSFPFVWASPMLQNQAEWQPGALVLRQPGLATTVGHPLSWLEQVRGTDALNVQVIARPAQLQQGPARLLTIAKDRNLRNLELAQEGDVLSVRVRTTESDNNGNPPLEIEGVFAPGRRCDLGVTLSPGRIEVRVDGQLRAHRDLPAGALRSWDPGYSLNLGNDPTGNRPWLGTIERAAVTIGTQVIDYANAQQTRLPQPLRTFYNRPRLKPLVPFELGDFIVNLFGFIPFGVVLAGLRPGRPRGPDIAAAFSLSLAIEVSQWWSPYRYPSINDLILNTLGGTLGLVLFDRWLGSRV
jgi:VanZ family protein